MITQVLIFLLFSYSWVHYTNSGNISSFAISGSTLFAGTNGGLLVVSMERDSILEKYTMADGFLQHEITDLEFSPYGGIWGGYQGKGLFYFKNGEIYNYDFSQTYSTNIFDIFLYQNYLIICDTASLKVISTKGSEDIWDDKVLIERLPEWSYGDVIKRVIVYRDTIFLGSENRVFYESFDEFIAGMSPQIVVDSVKFIDFKCINDTLFILTENGFLVYPSLDIYYMAWAEIFDIVSTDSMYFVATHWGVYSWSFSSGESEIFSGAAYRRVYVYNGKIFAGNFGSSIYNTGIGILVYNPALGDSLYPVKGKIKEIPVNMISSIAAYKNGFVCGYRTKGLSILEYGKESLDCLDGWVRGLDVLGHYIVAARFGGGGMFLIDASGNIIDTVFPTDYVFHTVKVVGDSLIIASEPAMGGIVFHSFRGDTIHPVILQEYLNDVEWDNGVVWAVTGPSTQIIKIDLGEDLSDPLDDEITYYDPGRAISALDIEVDENYIYVASTNGLFVYQKEPFTEYKDLTNFLPDTFCLGVEIDSRKSLWVLTLKGLVRIDYGYKSLKIFPVGPYSLMEPAFPGQSPQLGMGSEVLDIDEGNSKIICGTQRGVAVLELDKDYYTFTPLDSITVYPNPCRKDINKYIYIKTLSSLDKLMIFDLKGKKINLNFGRIQGGYRIESNKFKPGIYILIIEKDGKRRFIKFSVL